MHVMVNLKYEGATENAEDLPGYSDEQRAKDEQVRGLVEQRQG